MKINKLIFSLIVIISTQCSELIARSGGGGKPSAGRRYSGWAGGSNVQRGNNNRANNWAGWGGGWGGAPARQQQQPADMAAIYGAAGLAEYYRPEPGYDYDAPQNPQPEDVSNEKTDNATQDKTVDETQPLNPAVINVAARMAQLKDRPFLPENVEEAAKQTDMKTINEFLKEPKNINASDVNGRTLLIVAIKANNKPLVADLLKRGADPALADLMLLSPLHYAAFLGRLDLIQEIVPQWLSRPDKIFAKDKNGDTPQDLAKKRGHKTIVEFLEKFKTDDMKKEEKDTALAQLKALAQKLNQLGAQKKAHINDQKIMNVLKQREDALRLEGEKINKELKLLE